MTPDIPVDAANVLDFLAVDLVGGKLRIHVSTGESKVYVDTLSKGKLLNDGLFQHVRIYKEGTVSNFAVDFFCYYYTFFIGNSFAKP